MKFHRHYTLQEARELLPQVRKWLEQLTDQKQTFDAAEHRLAQIRSPGTDFGGQTANEWARSLAGIQAVLVEFERREIQLKDLDRGLVDFPSIRAEKEVFLCWERGEQDIEFWHDLNGGYAHRQPI